MGAQQPTAKSTRQSAERKIHMAPRPHMNWGITRWKVEPLKCRGLPERPVPFSPVHRQRKFCRAGRGAHSTWGRLGMSRQARMLEIHVMTHLRLATAGATGASPRLPGGSEAMPELGSQSSMPRRSQ